jgi:CubicO group peptidase (beta-lactamase class C family)
MKLYQKIILSSCFLFVILNISHCKKENHDTTIANKSAKNNLLMQKAPLFDCQKLTNNEIALKHALIDSFYKNNYKSTPANGSLLVAQNGQIIYEKYEGMANFSANTPIKSYTPLHIASVSKVITATAILKIINVGKIKLDQAVNTILTDFPYPDITIRALLNHRSGLQNYAYFTSPDSIWDKSKILTNQDILNILSQKKIPLNFVPNSHFTYCNTNYAILALVIEKIMKMTYKEAIQKIIFTPLEMKNSYVFDYQRDKNLAVPSYKKNKRLVPFDFLDGVYGDKNIYSTPRDLLKLDMARRASNFLKPNLLKQVYTEYSNEHKGKKNYGLGIRIMAWKTGQKMYFHNGWWHGNTSSYISLKKEKVTIIALSNKFTVNTYAVRKLTALFGDYPFELEKEKE